MINFNYDSIMSLFKRSEWLLLLLLWDKGTKWQNALTFK